MKSTTGQGGFTLLELLISVAILGIVVTIGAAAYADYTVKAQASEGLNMAAGVMQAYEQYHKDTGGSVPTANAAAGLPSLSDLYGKYVGSVAIMSTGTIRVSFRPDAADAIRGTAFDILPYETEGGLILWRCAEAPVPTNPAGTALPLVTGATTPAVPVGGVTPAEHLPSVCRS